MNIWITYAIVAIILLISEVVYLNIADKYDIIDIPSKRSSHTSSVLSGGGIIFTITMVLWSITHFSSSTGEGSFIALLEFLPFIIGLVLVAGVSFWNDIHPLSNGSRLLVQFAAMVLMFWSLFWGGNSWFIALDWYWQILIHCSPDC